MLLADEGVRGAAPRVTAQTVPAPLAPARRPPPGHPSLDQSVPGREGVDFRTHVVTGGGRPEWETALRADPDVRAFMEADPSG